MPAKLGVGSILAGFAIALIALMFVGPARAQSDTGRIEGVVTDAAGAAVTGASAAAVNLETNERHEATTNDDGFFVLTPLKPGNYTLEVSAPSFKKHERPDVEIQVSQTARIDAELGAGAITEVVEVTGGTPLIEASTSSLSQVIEEKKIIDLPLNGRNFTQLATLVPGVNRGTIGGVASGATNSTETFRQKENGGASISANGLREQNNNFLLDGIDNNESIVNTIVFFPPVEALQEFRVITSVAPAEFGRGGGAIINAVMKSGTNEFHGSMFEFFRNSALDARPTFASRKEVFNRHQYGATVGGPIDDDETFFFFSWQGLRQRLPVEAGNFVTVPTALMRQGNFSELLNPAVSCLRAPVRIYNPETNQPYPGNIIPSSQLNPVGLAYLNAYPLPTRGGALHNYEPGRIQRGTFDDFDARIDHRFNDEHTMFGRFSLARDEKFDGGRIPGYQAGFGSGTNRVNAESVALNYTTLFSPTAINEFRFGWIHGRTQFLPVNADINQNAQLGIPGIVGNTIVTGISLIGTGDGTYFEYFGDGGEFRLNQHTYQFSNAFTWIKGNHCFKFGATFIRRAVEGIPSDETSKGFYFFPDSVAFDGPPSAGFVGYPVAEVLVGRTGFTAAARQDLVNPPTSFSWENGFFVQDDWRVHRRVTLNLGLRYEVFPPYYEKEDRLANWDPIARRLVLAGQNGVSRGTVDTDWNNFGPRLGIAIDLTGENRTVLRGGYGLFYSLDRGGVGVQLTKNPPFFIKSYNFGGDTARIRISDPIPSPPVFDVNTDPNSLPQAAAIIFTPADTENTMVHQFNVTLEHQFSDYFALSTAYVGTRGENLLAVIGAGNGFDTSSVERRITTVANEADSRYDSLQIKANLRDWHGLSFLSAYTWGKSLDNAPGPFPGPGSGPFDRTDASDPENLDLDRGPSQHDRRHRFTFAGSWMVGDLDGTPDGVRYVLSDWQFNAIVSLESGAPFTVYGGFNRAQIDGNPYFDKGNPDRFLDTTAFRSSVDKNDQMERNSLTGPPHNTVDASIFRRFGITERLGVEIRVEAFNLFNTPQYASPGDPEIFLGNPNFGRIDSTIESTERQIQLGLRLTF